MKKIIVRMIGILFVMGTFAGCSTQTTEEEEIAIHSYLGDDKEITVENEFLSLQMDPLTTQYTVTDKKNNNVWYSNPANAEDDPLANGDAKGFIQSTLFVKYIDDIGVGATLNNYSYSVKNGLYDIETGEDYIKVNYTIGNIQKEYQIPIAITEERFQSFLDKMDKSDARKVKERYKKYDLSKIKDKDKKEELLELYPKLEQEVLYTLRETIQEYQKAAIEESFKAIGYSEDDYLLDSAEQEEKEESAIFNISVIYRLDGNDLLVELPVDQMEWKEDFPLAKVGVLPMFGAGSTEDEGYLLVPNGMGSIINFNNDKKKQNAFQTEVYGWDYGLKRDSRILDNRGAFAAFAIANNDASVLCEMEQGASLAEVNADISGRDHSYNVAYAAYDIIHSDVVAPSLKSYQSIIMFEKERPDTVITQRYQFVPDTDYAKIAGKYHDYLKDRYELTADYSKEVPLYVEIIGAIDKIEQQLGVPKSVITPLTTFSEATDMVADMKANGLSNLELIYTGWLDGGVSNDFIHNPDALKCLGGDKQITKFMDSCKENDIPVYLNANVLSTDGGSILDGFKQNRDVAQFITREYNERYPMSFVWYGEDEEQPSYYMLRPQTTLDSIKQLDEAASEYESTGIALCNVGNQLLADYNEKNHVTREENIKMQDVVLKDIVAADRKIISDGGNDYSLAYSSGMLNLELEGKEFGIVDEMIPFYPMAIHGLVHYTGNSINLSDDYQTSILKAVESGASLYFTFMKESTLTVQDSDYTDYFGADYEAWKEKAASITKRYQEELGECFKTAMISHKALEEGIVLTEYENGTKVYINYTNQDYRTTSGLIVPANDYVTEG